MLSCFSLQNCSIHISNTHTVFIFTRQSIFITFSNNDQSNLIKNFNAKLLIIGNVTWWITNKQLHVVTGDSKGHWAKDPIWYNVPLLLLLSSPSSILYWLGVEELSELLGWQGVAARGPWVSGWSGASGIQIDERHCAVSRYNPGRSRELLGWVDVYRNSAEHSARSQLYYESVLDHVTNTKINLAFHSSGVGKSGTGLSGWG